jgi:uncharacterized protein (TIGR02265 family)
MSQPNAPVVSPALAGKESAYSRYLPLPGPDDTVRGLFFSGLLNLVKRHGGELALRQCQQLLADKRFLRGFISFSSYPATDFLRVAHAASQVLAPQLGSLEATARQLGMATVRDFTHSMAGKTLLTLSGPSPARLLSNIPSAYRAAVSFGERKVTIQGNKAAHITFKRDFLPLAHSEGVILAVLEVSSAKNPQVRSRSLSQLDSEYDVTWE